MLSFQRRLLFVLFALLAVARAQDRKPRLAPLELDRSKSLRLSDYGGPTIDLRMKSREMSFIAIDIVDYTKMIPVAKTNIRGVTAGNSSSTAPISASSGVSMVPTRTTKNVEKRNPVNYSPSNHNMYLLYEEPSSRIKVYFLDSISRQNHDNFVVAVPSLETHQKESLINRHEPLPPTPDNPGERSAPTASPQFLSNELAAWYAKLGREREALDVNDVQAVQRFNKHAAEYQEALAKVRAATEALKHAPK